jgi:hypothetical protein
VADYWDKIKELETQKLSDFSLETLEQYHRELASLQREAGDQAPQARQLQRAISAQLPRLEGEIGRRHAATQHQQAMRVGKWTLFWAIIGGIASAGLLLREVPVSKLLHARSSTPLPSATPTPEPAQSNTPTASPTPSPAEVPIVHMFPEPTSKPKRLKKP